MRVTVYDASDEFEGTPLRELAAKVVDVAEDRTVAEVLEAAGHRSYRAFNLMTPEIESDVWAETQNGLVLAIDFFGLDGQGALWFSREVTWADLSRAAAARLYRGDPSELVVFTGGVAGGPIADGLWEAVQWLFQNRDTIDWTIKTVGSGAAALAWVDDQRQRMIARRWRRQGFTATRIQKVLHRVPAWDPSVLALRFRLTEQEARRALSNAGYQPAADGLWELSPSEVSQELARGLDALGEDAWANWETDESPAWLDEDPDGE